VAVRVVDVPGHILVIPLTPVRFCAFAGILARLMNITAARTRIAAKKNGNTDSEEDVFFILYRLIANYC
jgi:hypothetical protein